MDVVHPDFLRTVIQPLIRVERRSAAIEMAYQEHLWPIRWAEEQRRALKLACIQTVWSWRSLIAIAHLDQSMLDHPAQHLVDERRDIVRARNADAIAGFLVGMAEAGVHDHL